VPTKSFGKTTFPSLSGIKIFDRPVKKTAYNGVPDAMFALLKSNVTGEPGCVWLDEMEREGKALTGRTGLVDGQEVMKDAAMVKTSFKLRGTYKSYK
jgi:hypothetical protein